jgi:hypothetical protein
MAKFILHDVFQSELLSALLHVLVYIVSISANLK